MGPADCAPIDFSLDANDWRLYDKNSLKSYWKKKDRKSGQGEQEGIFYFSPNPARLDYQDEIVASAELSSGKVISTAPTDCSLFFRRRQKWKE